MSSWGAWNSSFAFSLVLIAVTIVIHVLGVVLIGSTMERLKRRMQGRSFSDLARAFEGILVITVVALWLAFLHGIESMVWAFAYVELHATNSAADAVLYSVDSMTTRGASGLQLERQWRMMGASEAGDGMLLFGISTAFLFYVMVHFWKSDAPTSDLNTKERP